VQCSGQKIFFAQRTFAHFFSSDLMRLEQPGPTNGNTVADGTTPLQPTEEQQGLEPAVKRVETAPSRQEGPDEACSAHLAVVIGYKGQGQTTELRLPQEIIAKLAFEAEFRDMGIGELIGALIAATRIGSPGNPTRVSGDRSAPGGVAFAPGAGPLMLIGDRWEWDQATS
jgi:hypothetical protein